MRMKSDDGNGKRKIIFQYLKMMGHVGADNAIYQKVLARLFGVTTNRLKQEIRAEQWSGALIASNGHGYFIPGNHAEAARYCRMMRNQAISRLKTIKSVREYSNEVDGQLSVDDLLKEWDGQKKDG